MFCQAADGVSSLSSRWERRRLRLSLGRRLEITHSVRLPILAALLSCGFASNASAVSWLQAASQEVSSAQDSAQTTPQNPPPPSEANPAPPGQKPRPSPENPAPSAQLPEPAIRNPEVRPAPRPEIAPPTLNIPRLTHAPALEDFLNMKPQGEGAMQMAKVSGFVQRNPHDGAKVSEETAAYLGYDRKNLYVVFICFDDPKKSAGTNVAARR